jgi:hypothetical protein
MTSRRKQGYAHAVQITDATFDDAHPNNTHISGVQYIPLRRCVFVPTATGLVSAKIGDWIVQGRDGVFEVFSGEDFEMVYGGKT